VDGLVDHKALRAQVGQNQRGLAVMITTSRRLYIDKSLCSFVPTAHKIDVAAQGRDKHSNQMSPGRISAAAKILRNPRNYNKRQIRPDTPILTAVDYVRSVCPWDP